MIISTYCIGQKPENIEAEYFKKVKQFYQCLEKDFVSTQECMELFGNDVLENESSIFFEECIKSNTEEICRKKYDKYFADHKKSNSLFFKKIKKVKNLFIQVFSDSIDVIINKSTIYDENNSGYVSLDVKFPSGKIIYFYLNKYTDEPLYITNIYLSNGEEFYNYLGYSKKNYLKRIGIINKAELYTSVREKPSENSKVIWTLGKNELFYFTPNSENSWWKITNINSSKSGYIESYKVEQYGYLSDDKKINDNYITPFIKLKSN